MLVAAIRPIAIAEPQRLMPLQWVMSPIAK